MIGAGTIMRLYAYFHLRLPDRLHLQWLADRLDNMIATAWPQLEELGVVVAAAAPRPVRAASPEEVVAGATVIQESALENMAVKRALRANGRCHDAGHVIPSSTSD